MKINKPEGHKYPRKFKGDWDLIGQGHPMKSVIGHPAMKGRRWTIDYNYDSGKTFSKLKEYEGDIENDEFNFNLTADTKGERNLMKERHMNYANHFKHLKESQFGATDKPAKVNYTDNDHFDNEGGTKKDVPNVSSPMVPNQVAGNELKGGIGDSTAPADVIPHELAMGVTTEMEHTSDVKIATEIALDHLTKDPHYYTKLNNAGLAPEFKNGSPSGYGDPTSTFNQEDRLGSAVTCGPGNNIVGSIGNTPDGHVDGKKDSKPIINKTVDIDVEEPTFDDLAEAVLSEKKKGGKRKPKPTNPSLWSRAKAAARSKFDVYPSAYANGWAAKWYKSHGGGWRMSGGKK